MKKLTVSNNAVTVLNQRGNLDRALEALWDERAVLKKRAAEVDGLITQLSGLTTEKRIEAREALPTLKSSIIAPTPSRKPYLAGTKVLRKCEECKKNFRGRRNQRFHSKRCGDIWYAKNMRAFGIKVGIKRRGKNATKEEPIPPIRLNKIPRYTKLCGNPECPNAKPPGYKAWGPKQSACKLACKEKMKELGIQGSPNIKDVAPQLMWMNNRSKAKRANPVTLVQGDPLRAGR